MQGAKGNGHNSADKADDVEHHAEVWGGQLYQEGFGVHVEKGASTSARMDEGDKAKRTCFWVRILLLQMQLVTK